MSDLDWQTPPPSGSSPVKYFTPKVLEELKAHPGEWARVASAPMRYGHSRFSPARSRFKRRGFEAVVRQDDSGEVHLYVRWPE
jgi:hypothetical protein